MRVKVVRLSDGEAISQAMRLAWDVFLRFEASDYDEEGIRTFHDFITNEKEVERLSVYGAYNGDGLVGVLATRSAGSHISLFFVEESAQRQGVGRSLFEAAVRDCPTGTMTVHAAPCAVAVYQRLGFASQSDEMTRDGLRFTPMTCEKPVSFVPAPV